MLSRQLLAPPVGGALFDRWGYRAPFIFTILFTIIDLPVRLLVNEKRVPAHPTAAVQDTKSAEGTAFPTYPLDSLPQEEAPVSPGLPLPSLCAEKADETQQVLDIDAKADAVSKSMHPSSMHSVPERELSLLQVIFKMATSIRALVVLFCIFFPSFVFMSTIE